MLTLTSFNTIWGGLDSKMCKDEYGDLESFDTELKMYNIRMGKVGEF